MPLLIERDGAVENLPKPVVAVLCGYCLGGGLELRIGLVTEVWPIEELFERAQGLARELAGMPKIAVAGMLRCVVDAGALVERPAGVGLGHTRGIARPDLQPVPVAPYRCAEIAAAYPDGVCVSLDASSNSAYRRECCSPLARPASP